MIRWMPLVAFVAACGNGHTSAAEPSVDLLDAGPSDATLSLALDAVPQPAPLPDAREPVRHPEVSGFYCADIERDSVEDPPLVACYRDAGLCQEFIELAKKAQRTVLQDCDRRDTAYCFLMTNIKYHSTDYRCFGDEVRCSVAREEYKKTDPELIHGPCQWTASSQLYREPIAAHR